MIDIEMVKIKIGLIQADLKELLRFKDLSFEEIAKNYDKHKVVERILELVINEAIDINQHLIAESDLGKLPFDFKESFTLLSRLNIYSEDFAQEIAKSVGLRNILVHQYRKLDEQIFYQSINLCLEQYHKYCAFIIKYTASV